MSSGKIFSIAMILAIVSLLGIIAMQVLECKVLAIF